MLQEDCILQFLTSIKHVRVRGCVHLHFLLPLLSNWVCSPDYLTASYVREYVKRDIHIVRLLNSVLAV